MWFIIKTIKTNSHNFDNSLLVSRTQLACFMIKVNTHDVNSWCTCRTEHTGLRLKLTHAFLKNMAILGDFVWFAIMNSQNFDTQVYEQNRSHPFCDPYRLTRFLNNNFRATAITQNLRFKLTYTTSLHKFMSRTEHSCSKIEHHEFKHSSTFIRFFMDVKIQGQTWAFSVIKDTRYSATAIKYNLMEINQVMSREQLVLDTWQRTSAFPYWMNSTTKGNPKRL